MDAMRLREDAGENLLLFNQEHDRIGMSSASFLEEDEHQQFPRKERDKDQKGVSWFSTLAKLLIPSALIRTSPDLLAKEREVTQVRLLSGEALDELDYAS